MTPFADTTIATWTRIYFIGLQLFCTPDEIHAINVWTTQSKN